LVCWRTLWQPGWLPAGHQGHTCTTFAALICAYGKAMPLFQMPYSMFGACIIEASSQACGKLRQRWGAMRAAERSRGRRSQDLGSQRAAERFLERAQNKHGFGLIAVSLGYAETLLSVSGASTSSELSPAERAAAGARQPYPDPRAQHPRCLSSPRRMSRLATSHAWGHQRARALAAFLLRRRVHPSRPHTAAQSFQAKMT